MRCDKVGDVSDPTPSMCQPQNELRPNTNRKRRGQTPPAEHLDETSCVCRLIRSAVYAGQLVECLRCGLLPGPAGVGRPGPRLRPAESRESNCGPLLTFASCRAKWIVLGDFL